MLFPCLDYIRFPTMSASEYANNVAKYMRKEDVANILLYICTTIGPKPRCRFSAKPRNYTPPCECRLKRINCFYCFGMDANTPGSKTARAPGNNNGRPVSRRADVPAISTPPCYCACRTRGFCTAARFMTDEGNQEARAEQRPRRVLSRENMQEAHRPGWRF